MDEETKDISFELDLDTLVRPSVYVKLGGQAIEVKPPTLETLLKVTKISRQMKELEGKPESDGTEASKAFDNFKEAIYEIIPDIKGKELNISQVIALMNLVMKLAEPSDTTELKKQGISIGSDQKKIQPDSLNQSPIS